MHIKTVHRMLGKGIILNISNIDEMLFKVNGQIYELMFMPLEYYQYGECIF